MVSLNVAFNNASVNFFICAYNKALTNTFTFPTFCFPTFCFPTFCFPTFCFHITSIDLISGGQGRPPLPFLLSHYHHRIPKAIEPVPFFYSFFICSKDIFLPQNCLPASTRLIREDENLLLMHLLL